MMKQPIGRTLPKDAHKRATHERKPRRPVTSGPRSTATVSAGEQAKTDPAQLFVEGAQHAIDPDLHHRMISESAYRRYAARGYVDGYDLDDWLQAEAEVDQLHASPRRHSRE